MNIRKVILLMSCFFLLNTLKLSAGNINLSDPVPVDENVLIGKLENGLTYYIRKNATPENFAQLRLVIKAGSVLEDDNQAGLAHFTEHMAFNGTENFPNNTLLEYLNTVGMGFSGGLNAFTSFDETVYMLSSRTDDKEQLDTSFLILSDWAARLTFDHDEIDSERGVIMEEWRGGRGANERMGNKQREVLFEGSKYAERMPIGTPEVIENFEYQLIKDFYNDWYRPDLQAVVAVGDFEVDEIKDLIIKHFTDIKPKDNPRPYPNYQIPEHDETKYSFVTDREATHTFISLIHKHPAKKIETINDYRSELIVQLLNTMLNNRFTEISRKEDSPFTYAVVYKQALVNPIQVYTLNALVDEKRVMDAFELIFTEVERVKQHGFYESELLRAKDILIKNLERNYLEMDKTNSQRYVWAYTFNFLKNQLMMSEAQEYNLAQAILPEITINDIRQAIDLWITEKNRIVGLTGIDKPDFTVPAQEDVENILVNVSKQTLSPYLENILDEPLLSNIPVRTRVRKPKFNKKTGIHHWKLPNGINVYLKETDFRNNEILMSGFRYGGLSVAEDDIFLSAKVSGQIINESGIGQFDKNSLEKYLSGKDVYLMPELRAKNESFSGRSSVKDLETMFQLLWMYFNEHRFDENAFATWKRKIQTGIANVENSPEYTFNDSLYNVLYNYHLRSKQIHLSDLDKINHQDAYNFFTQRFSTADGFNFVFVGNANPEILHNFIETYMANIPKGKETKHIIDRNVRYNRNGSRINVFKGQDDKSIVRLIYTNDYKYNLKDNITMTAANSVLFEMLLENIRERMSGVYSIYPFPVIENKPYGQMAIHISFGCDPNRVDEIIDAVRIEIEKIKNNDFDDKYLNTFKSTYKKRIEVQAKTNKYFLDRMEDFIFNDVNFRHLDDGMGQIDKLTNKDISDIIKRYIDFDKKIIIVLYPENHKL